LLLGREQIIEPTLNERHGLRHARDRHTRPLIEHLDGLHGRLIDAAAEQAGA